MLSVLPYDPLMLTCGAQVDYLPPKQAVGEAVKGKAESTVEGSLLTWLAGLAVPELVILQGCRVSSRGQQWKGAGKAGPVAPLSSQTFACLLACLLKFLPEIATQR